MDPINILLVDDSKSARYALRLQLQRHGVLVDTADSAESALERIGEKPPDAVLMDHTMPGMNGFEALDVIKSDPGTAHIPVVMCTSHDDPAYAAQALKRGALTVLSKAAAVDKLPEVLEQIQEALSAQVKLSVPLQAAPPPEAPAPQAVAAPATAPLPPPAPGPTPAEVEAWIAAYLTRHLAEAMEPHLGRLNTHLRQVIAEQVEMAVDALPPPPAAPAPAPLPAPAPVPVVQAPAIDLDNLRDEIVPAAVRRHFDRERDGILQLMQQCIQETQTQRGDDADALPKLLETAEAKMTDKVTQIATREAEAAVRTALARDGGALAAMQRGLRLSYGLGATAIVVAVCAAAAVYVLLT